MDANAGLAVLIVLNLSLVPGQADIVCSNTLESFLEQRDAEEENMEPHFQIQPTMDPTDAYRLFMDLSDQLLDIVCTRTSESFLEQHENTTHPEGYMVFMNSSDQLSNMITLEFNNTTETIL